MKLVKPLPKGRSLEQVKHHYAIEKNLANRLKSSNREERGEILRTMYDELFRLVPDHPRLTRRSNAETTARANRGKLRLLRPFLSPSKTVLEFAPGDCRFSYELSQRCTKVYAIDISDQRAPADSPPTNFELILYDGYQLDLTSMADVVFSDQFLEHLHPEDVDHHFRLVLQMLRDSGCYVFRTPHRFTGPHDISQYFSSVPEGFHLKEWTYTELGELLKRRGFRSWHGLWQKKSLCIRVPFGILRLAEAIHHRLPSKLRRPFAHLFVPRLSMVAVK